MHITITVLADSRNVKAVERGRLTLKALTRQYDPSELSILPIEWIDDPNNAISIWSNVQASDIVLVMLSEELLDALDELTDVQSGNNLIGQEILVMRADRHKYVIPILLASCSWDDKGSIFKGLQPIPRDRALSAGDKDKAWAMIAGEINRVIRASQNASVTQPSRKPATAVVAPIRHAQTATIVTCPRCGSDLLPGATICRDCGTSFGKPQRQAPTMANSVLVVASKKDRSYTEACIKHLRTAGLQVIDANEINAGNRIDQDFKDKVSRTKCAVFLLSADYLSDQYTDSFSAAAKASSQFTATIMRNSFAVIIRPCSYEYFEIQGVYPNTVLTLDNKPFSNSRRVEESWLALAQQIKN